MAMRQVAAAFLPSELLFSLVHKEGISTGDEGCPCMVVLAHPGCHREAVAEPVSVEQDPSAGTSGWAVWCDLLLDWVSPVTLSGLC